MSDDAEDPTRAADIEVVLAVNLFFVDDGREEIGSEHEQRPMEGGRCDADDGVGMLVHADDAADDAAVRTEVVLPIRVSKHKIRRAIGTMLIGGMEESA